VAKLISMTRLKNVLIILAFDEQNIFLAYFNMNIKNWNFKLILNPLEKLQKVMRRNESTKKVMNKSSFDFYFSMQKISASNYFG
jgi:hypothetical protein